MVVIKDMNQDIKSESIESIADTYRKKYSNRANNPIIKRIEAIERTIIELTQQVYLHVEAGIKLKEQLDSLVNSEEIKATLNSGKLKINVDKSEISGVEILQCFSLLFTLCATYLLLHSWKISLIVTLIGLGLAVFQPKNVIWEKNIKQYCLWQYSVSAYTIAVLILEIFAMRGQLMSESGQFIWILAMCSAVSLFMVCLSGRNWPQTISQMWSQIQSINWSKTIYQTYLQIQKWWLRFRIISENQAAWKYNRRSRIDLAVREHANLLDVNNIPYKFFSDPSIEIIEKVFGYNPYPSRPVPVQRDSNPKQQTPQSGEPPNDSDDDPSATQQTPQPPDEPSNNSEEDGDTEDRANAAYAQEASEQSIRALDRRL
jgi:hypothetical protein